MGIKIIANHKRARFDYHLHELVEAGIMLQGTEVKSLRNGKVSINEAFIQITPKDEVWIHNMYIPLYEFGNIHNHTEKRKRKLLLHHKEILQIKKEMQSKGMTIIPIKLYFKKSLVKIEIALAKGKKLYDKRQDQAKKDVERKIRQGKYE